VKAEQPLGAAAARSFPEGGCAGLLQRGGGHGRPVRCPVALIKVVPANRSFAAETSPLGQLTNAREWGTSGLEALRTAAQPSGSADDRL